MEKYIGYIRISYSSVYSCYICGCVTNEVNSLPRVFIDRLSLSIKSRRSTITLITGFCCLSYTTNGKIKYNKSILSLHTKLNQMFVYVYFWQYFSNLLVSIGCFLFLFVIFVEQILGKWNLFSELWATLKILQINRRSLHI